MCTGQAAAILLTLFGAADAPSGERASLDAVLEPIRARHDLPALGGAIVSGSRVTAIGVVGVRRMGSLAPVTVRDPWHVGSCTKSMTATLLACLVEDGKLRWGSTLGDLLPDLRERMHAAYRDVTVEQLLTHRAGLPGDLLADRKLWSELAAFEDRVVPARRLLLERLLSREPESPPGTKYVYSNAGYIVAGAVAETLTGRPWEDLLRAQLFEPLGMRSAGFGAPGRPGSIDAPKVDAPWGHARRDGGLAPLEPGPKADNPPFLGPAGTVHITLEDWARYASFHLAGARGKPTPFLGAETFRRLHGPPAGDYAFGWLSVERDWAGGRALTHNGSNTYWFATIWLAPKRDLAVVVVTNCGGDPAEKACDEASWALIRKALGRD